MNAEALSLSLALSRSATASEPRKILPLASPRQNSSSLALPFPAGPPSPPFPPPARPCPVSPSLYLSLSLGHKLSHVARSVRPIRARLFGPFSPPRNCIFKLAPADRWVLTDCLTAPLPPSPDPGSNPCASPRSVSDLRRPDVLLNHELDGADRLWSLLVGTRGRRRMPRVNPLHRFLRVSRILDRSFDLRPLPERHIFPAADQHSLCPSLNSFQIKAAPKFGGRVD
ncbi:hypothetical protein MPTK1_4g12840 [Marchantia polymorpha subsp. ruderalis]|uniref:Uncharacterized protein n=2 Tax=Marchantia polymorpha TaxID=3197 RepID=A0AAF6B9B4_MARPO|nr:hypothetical protein MARPO_0138s0021 [Marchantia polymorpha]BBN08598.1 hypothetical protein Mp_4g12840 [Marchantia polymorpha subsp. ruderalis]|eukprot:PTQ29585.1 hypothetical protein MARPO_0138s0021 [Marchantia polymorpha]